MTMPGRPLLRRYYVICPACGKRMYRPRREKQMPYGCCPICFQTRRVIAMVLRKVEQAEAIPDAMRTDRGGLEVES